MKPRSLFAAAAVAISTTLAASAFAQQFPSKPIRIVVPFPAGSATDTITRIIGQSVSNAVGQPVVVDNKAGADGAIAGAEVAKASPDGYTLFMATNSPMAVVPATKKSPPYDVLTDFTPITDIGRYTFFLFINADSPIKTFKDMVSFAKANPKKLDYATGNTTGIMSFAQMNALAGIEMNHIPYKGEPQAVTDVVAGRAQLVWATPTTALAQARAGKLRALATNLKARSKLLPDVPTMAEVGIPQYSVASWAAVYGPGKMPRDLQQRLNKEFTDALKRPDVAAALEKQVFTTTGSTTEELAAFTRAQLESYRAIVKSLGMQPE